MRYLFLLTVAILVSCAPSMRELMMVELKSQAETLFVPKPFVLCYRNKMVDTAAADTIVGYIRDKLAQMAEPELEIEWFEFDSREDYITYGRELSRLVHELESKDMEEVALSPFLKDLVGRSRSDLSVLVYTLADPKTKGQIVGRAIATIGLGVTVGLLTGFAPVLMPDMVSSRMHVIVYSKSRDRVISYEDEEDKDDPLQREYTYEQVETLFSDFAEAGKE